MKYPGSLHNHCDFSNFRLRDSINKIDSLIDYAIELGHKCVAFTEHETIANAVRIEEYYNKVKEKNPDFKVIRGNEIYLVRDGLNEETYDKTQDVFYHFILLAKDAEGHKQIRQISTRAWLRAWNFGPNKMTRVPTYYSDLEEIIGPNPGHVIASTACLGGALAKQLLLYKETQDENLYLKIQHWCKYLLALFGKNHFYLEMQPSENEEQIYVNKEILKLSKELKIPYIITTDSHYLKKEDAFIHKAFLTSQDGEREVDEFYQTTYMMSDEELRNYMGNSIGEEELQKAYENIDKIQSMCEDYSLKQPLHIPCLKWNQSKPIKDLTFWLNKIPYLNKFLNSDAEEDKLFAKILINKIEEDHQYQNERTYEELNECLKDTWVSSEVNNAHWSAYFLNLQKIVETCWEAGTLVGCGRGSGVGFLPLNMLDIVQINPLRENTATFRWRFLNPARVSVLDVDIDIESSKRSVVLNRFRDEYGKTRVANVLTLGTEQSKSAILTAARGLGIDVDEARYLSSMIESDRGQLRTLKQTYYGDEENGFLPNKQFCFEMDNNYPELWQVAQKIEGLICRSGIHAGGVIFVDQDICETAALMRASSGEIITQFELHDAEKLSLIKYDILSIEALDRIHICLDLLAEYGYIEPKDTLKETYESVIGVYKLERNNLDMWKMCWNHKVTDLFQMEKQSGIKGISLLRPTSVDDLAVLNSAIRLMPSEKGAEMPVNKLARFKANEKYWDKELADFGLGEKEKNILKPVVGISYGLSISQEQFMQLVQLPELGGFDLGFADKLRKSIAKKNPAEYEALTKQYYETIKEKKLNERLCYYTWDVLIAMSRGYGFNASHTLAYSMVGLQELNLAHRFPTIFWDTACIIAGSGAADEEAEAATDYSKLARAIGAAKNKGIHISLADINKSSFGFIPDVEENKILFGLKGIQGIGDEVVLKIIDNRPYRSIKEFIQKINPNKTVMVNLIKSGAFDNLIDRKKAMVWYIWEVCGKKNNLTLQNMGALLKYNLIPNTEELILSKRVYEFNRYIKSMCKTHNGYILDERAFGFITELGVDSIVDIEMFMSANAWDNIYQSYMDVIRVWLNKNKEETLEKLNFILFDEEWEKQATGNISAWEMEVLCFYYHEHELKNLNLHKYNIQKFNDLPETPEIDRTFEKGGKVVNLYKLGKICGTCIAKDKTKATVSLLTTEGVVTVKFRKEYFNLFDKQISIKGEDGKKHVVESSWFNRGNKLLICGLRSEEEFIAKKYASTGGHQLYKITDIDEQGDILLCSERYKGGIEEDA